METNHFKKQYHSKAAACSKLLLFGEHAAVHGFPAVGLPLPSKLTVSISVGHDDSNHDSWRYEHIAPDYVPQFDRLIRELQTLIPEFQTITHGKITIHSDIVPAVGLGSSAALCVALVEAVVGLFPQLHTDSAQIWNWAHRWEHIFHGSPSGIDTGLSHHNTLCAFYPETGELPRTEIINDVNLHLLICIFKRHSNTHELVTQLNRKTREDKETGEQLRRLGQIAGTAIDCLKKNQEDLALNLGDLALQAQALLSGLHLSIPEQVLFLNAGLKEGAPGGKLSGAGGGGAFYLIARDYNHLMMLSEKLRNISKKMPFETKPSIQAVIWENEASRFV